MWSQYLRTKKRGKVVALFHELHPDPIFCSSKQWADIIAGTGTITKKFIKELKQRKLIINTPKDDSREFEIAASGLEDKLNQPTILYLMTSWNCNLDCKYCPFPKLTKNTKAQNLSTKNAFAGIDLWVEHLKEKYDPDLQYFVIFYGGEPLLNKKVIRDSLDYLKKKQQMDELPNNINIMLATNGILVDDEIIALCKKYKITVTVGLDGPKSINDVLKIDNNGTGTFDKIVDKIKLLIKRSVKTCVSASITPFNIHQISDYSKFFAKLGVEKFGFNFLKGRALLELVGQGGLENYYRMASRGIIKNALNQKNVGFEYQMEKKQTAFDNKNFFPVDCTCYGNQIVIQPDGQISNCPFFNAKLGHIKKVGDNFRIWNQPIIKEWRKRLPLFHPGEAKALSGGGCAWSCKELKDDFLAIDDSSKIFAEEALDELIWSQYEKNKTKNS